MTDRDWKAVRAAYEAGAGPRELARRFGGSPGTYTKRAAAEGWSKPAETETGNGKRKGVSVSKSEGGKAKGRGKGGDAGQHREAAPPSPPPLEDPENLEGLTLKQRRFIREYLIDCNATRAAKAAGYSEDSASDIGHQLTKNSRVSAAIAEAERLRAERTNITADRVRLELARMGFANMTDFARWSGAGVELRDSDDLPDELAAAVLEVSETKDGVRIKLGKMPALRILAEHTGLIGRREEDGGQGGHEQGLTDLE